MVKDAQGHSMTEATREVADLYDQSVRAFLLSFQNPLSFLDKAIEAAPRCAMLLLAKAWILAGATDAVLMGGARQLLSTAQALPMDDRERAHAEALRHAVLGHRDSAIQVLDRLLMRHPNDLIAHMAALILDAFRGKFSWVASRSARAMPQWSKDQPGYGLMLAIYGFGLEEARQYAQAEDVGREAAEREPYGYWPHHGVSHVLEMTGRPEQGLKWMDDRRPFWSTKDNNSRVHIWWHKALFHMELGQYDQAMAIYDGPIAEAQRPLGLVLTNASALLWRLDTVGCNAGERWQQVMKLWEGRTDGKLCVFADVHAAMAEIGAGARDALEQRLALMHATATDGTEKAAGYRDIGLPVVKGFAAFHDGKYTEAVEHLLPARYDLWRLGGSAAQQDVVEWTLTEAAARAGLRDVAAALAGERLQARPESLPNQRFRDEAERIAS